MYMIYPAQNWARGLSLQLSKPTQKSITNFHCASTSKTVGTCLPRFSTNNKTPSHEYMIISVVKSESWKRFSHQTWISSMAQLSQNT